MDMDPTTLVEVAIEAIGDQSKLASVLTECASDDPFFRFAIDEESGQTIIKGRDKQHLDANIEMLRRTHGLILAVGAPQVAYREKLTKRVEKDYTYKKQTGGTGQFARVKIVFEPNEPGAGTPFESKIVGGAVPKEFIPGVEKGINSVMGAGVLAGFPVVDVKATLIDGAYHDDDSSVLAFEIASRAAFREALREGASVLLEPVMRVEVTTLKDYTGSIMGDLVHRGQVQGQDTRGNAVVINAMVPLANMFGYDNQLRSFSQGRATYTMQFAEYWIVRTPTNDDPRFPPAAAAMSA